MGEWRSVLLVLLLLQGCATAVPVPGEREVAYARKTDPEADLPLLTRGRERFVVRCSGCHVLPDPRSETPGEWPGILDDMSIRAKLAPEDHHAVLAYLEAVSGSH